ncbi:MULTISPECIES: FMN-binding protein [unclassified Curtobacterium]|uniref:FMN-binding protein n=1 Tax=unclassified Curtobacterium TaxID=257496 RepID=UPI000DA82072|nr:MULTISPECIES: FMN-binding protein [unclassified Curtobacterium]PZE23912.1 FMN-binding protein [Curtobacterium sp. MCBD17_028]WIE53512.1 FMN-binding protein [Curtobacterium sp. MCBD17_003]
MRKRALIGGVLASVAVVLGSWEVGQPHTTTTTTTPAASGDDGGSSSGSSSSGSSSSGSSSSGSTSSGSTSTATFTDGTFTGSTVSTQYGDVQVQVTVSGGKITAVTPLHLTDAEQRSVMISEQAAPLLEDEVLSAQSADVDTISGATYTSDAYLQSLQAALDEAR